MIGREALDLLLDLVELADAFERLLGDRRSRCGMHIEELSPHMGPAGGLDDAGAGEQLVKAGIAVGMDRAAERLQMGSRMLTLAVWRVKEQRCRRATPSEEPLVAHIRP